MDGWGNIPDVLLLNVYSHLSFNDKLAASSTCKQWRELLFHPANWSHVNFCYAGAEEVDRKRENFLKFRTGHFISSCGITIPTEPQLLADNHENNCCGWSGHIDTDVSSLFQYLCINKNLSQLSIVQSSLYQASADLSTTVGKPLSNYQHLNENQSPSCHNSLQGSTAFSIARCTSNNSRVEGTSSREVIPLTTCSTGVMTRSKSQKMREQQRLKSYQVPCNEYVRSSQMCGNVDFIFTPSNECSLDSYTNFPVFNENRHGSKPQYVDYLKQIIATCNSLKHLSLGFVPSITLRNNEIAKCLARYQSENIKSLHFSRCQELLEFVYQPIDAQDLLMFRSVQHLSLDTTDVSDQLLVSLSEGRRVKLESLCLSLFNHREGVRIIHDRTWDLIHQSSPNLKLTLNIIRCPEAIRDMMTVINGSMPLTHLTILFCDEFYVSGFHHVARHQASTLRSLHIVESMREGPMFYDISVDEQDPFVMMAWRCKNLSSFSVIGIALREHDVLAVARLRGIQLRKFELLEECITAFNHGETEFEEDFSMSFETFCEEISTSIGQDWLPLTEEDVDDSVHYFDSPESGAILPILMKDQRFTLSRGV